MTRALVVALACCAHPRAITPPAVPSYQLGTLRVDGAPPLDRGLRDAIDARSQAHGAELLDLSADGAHVLALSAGYIVELDAPGAAPRARPADPDLLVDTALFASEVDQIVLVGDRGGDELTRLYRQGTGLPVPLGDNTGRVGTPVWDRARRVLAWGRAIDTRSELWLGDGTGAGRRIFAADGLWQAVDVDADRVLAVHEISDATSAIYQIDVATGAATPLTPVVAGIAAPVARFGAGGRVFAISDALADHRELVELTPRGPRALVADVRWDVTSLAVAGDGSAIAFTTDEDGASVLHLYEVASGARRELPAPVAGVIDRVVFATGAARFAFSVTDARHPREIYSYDLTTRALVQWTHADLAGRSPESLVAPTLAHAPGGDLAIPIWEYASEPVPSGHATIDKAPVIVELHGGPQDQWQPGYDGFAQVLVEQGFAIVRPNVRGSLGYGRRYAALDDGPHRTDAVRDVGAVLDWIATRPELDARRVVVMGTSYGGYLAVAALLAYPDRLRGAIDLVGIADFVTFLEATSPHRRDQRRAEYGDERDPKVRAFLARISPLTHAAELRRPLFVAHGRRDSRVPAADADRLVAAARRAGQPVWYLTAADEGHGFTRVEHRVVFQTLAIQFLRALTAR